ncbi:hypothetical protein FHR75_001735 [Kineococcus radiotolerans]|uniref:Uncharacterized protein n=1 Tax=Kineococcus radiotolerans TaxID=131568 RepID=A0A7W4XWZ5_KINRA|nr:hypothetical protein [Kineococcus radiotolerans]
MARPLVSPRGPVADVGALEAQGADGSRAR